ncbi:hypothetical protein PR048_015930 [Dryococelus australis]|uniref:Polyprotein n=1 Tax=Dryococelus australis TaxID=614101 RepID=A0ABQ9HIC4_9NEOP|nr:hypothetical protein PR048_015930 [Dryococelus australis]
MRDDHIKDRIVCGIRHNTLKTTIAERTTVEVTDKRLEMFQEEAAGVHEVVTCSNVRLQNSGLKNRETTRLGMDQWRFHCDWCGTKHERHLVVIVKICVFIPSHKTTVAEWTAKIEVMNFHFLKFKLDTGAQVNLVLVKLFQSLNVSHKHLLRSNIRLVNYLEKIPFLKKCYRKCTYNGRVRVLEFYVFEKDSSRLLGLSTCVMLDLVRKLETVQSKTPRF